MKLPYVKPYRSVDDCLELMQERGLVVRDATHAKRALTRIGYYRLSAFSYPFREFCQTTDGRLTRCERFKDGATFDQVMSFYLFDKALRMELMDAIERIEIAIRTALIEVIGAVNPQGHLDPRTYKPRFSESKDGEETDFAKFVVGLEETFKGSKEEFAKHFGRNYSGNPPIWVKAGTWQWGHLTHILRFLDEAHKTAIAERINPNLPRKTMQSWVSALNDVRNDCAHHSRLWNKPLINSPGLPKAKIIPELDHLRERRVGDDAPTKRIYSAIVVMIYILKQFYPKTQWQCRLKNRILAERLPAEIGLATAGFPDGWEMQPIWQ
ncbi:Abi family protein [Ruegeria sp. HKCCA6837]|uniref:Abi family protein n=1 Tax=Ruegeria sp. HKCCA6837 TaxID=2682989 RepID=UPI001C2B992E|nr:Abi family protein [Ruegeria sp. HKCCA6837]